MSRKQRRRREKNARREDWRNTMSSGLVRREKNAGREDWRNRMRSGLVMSERSTMPDEQRKQLEQKKLDRSRIGDRQRIPSIIDTQPGINRERQPINRPINFQGLRGELMRSQIPQQIQQIPPQSRSSEIQNNLMNKPENMPVQPPQSQIQNTQQTSINQPLTIGPQQQEQQMKQQLIPQKTPDQETEEEKLKRLGISPV